MMRIESDRPHVFVCPICRLSIPNPLGWTVSELSALCLATHDDAERDRQVTS